MATIKKIFVQKNVSHDCEARNWVWEDTNENYEDLKNLLMTKWDSWFDGVRIVEKIFDDETFTITIKPIKTARRAYEGFHWKEGAIEEEVNEER